MPSTTIDNKLTPGTLHVYTAPDVSIRVLEMAIDQLCVAFVQAHTWHSPRDGIACRVTELHQMETERRFQTWAYFAVKILGLRADNGPHGGDVQLAIADDCIAAGLLIKHPEFGYVEPDYYRSDAPSPNH